MFYFRQNIKLSKMSEQDSKALYLLFKASKAGYNEIIHSYIKKPLTERLEVNSDVIRNSKNFKMLGRDLTFSIVMNFGINKSNFLKSEGKFNRPKYRTDKSEFFLYFSSRRINVNYNTKKIRIQLNQKFIELDIPENFSERKQNVKAVRLHKSLVGYYLVYEFQKQKKEPLCISYNIQNSICTKKQSNSKLFKAGLDLGVDALISVYSTNGTPLIISGKFLKFVNYQNNFLLDKLDPKKDSEKIEKIHYKRKQKINSIFNFVCKRLFDYLNYNNVGILYVGDFQGVKEKKTSRNFYQISYYLLIRKMKDYAKKNGIKMIMQEESYTSKTSFLDFEKPEKQNFKGERVKRGLFITGKGHRIHADVNGAAQILSKKHFTIERENALKKPYYLDLINPKVKVMSKIESYLRTIYKRESKIKEILDQWKSDPESFVNENYIAFDGINGHGTKEFAKYCRKTKKIVVNL